MVPLQLAGYTVPDWAFTGGVMLAGAAYALWKLAAKSSAEPPNVSLQERVEKLELNMIEEHGRSEEAFREITNIKVEIRALRRSQGQAG